MKTTLQTTCVSPFVCLLIAAGLGMPGCAVAETQHETDAPLWQFNYESDRDGEDHRPALPMPEGNYLVRVQLGDARRASDTAVKAEARRYMVPRVALAPGEFRDVAFVVNVRTPALPDGGQVRLRDREKDRATWDADLSLEFLGERPAVRSIEVFPAEAVTVFLLGDSTVVDQPDEPWAGWGQMLPVFFGPTVAVSNHAESGRAVSSFVAERRFEKAMAMMKPGDYALIQFGHNDMKEKWEGAGAYGNFTEGLRKMLAAIRENGGHPVLVTPMHRRWFNDDGTVKPTHGDYPQAMRDLAEAEDVPLIDLQNMSGSFYEALGPEGSKGAFVHYPAGTFPGQTERLKDDSHHNNYGAYVLARCVVEGIREHDLPLARHLIEGLKPFDPGDPPTAAAVDVPTSGSLAADETPEGN